MVQRALRVLVGVAVAALVLVAVPAQATVTTAYGSLSAAIPSVGACPSGGTCGTASATVVTVKSTAPPAYVQVTVSLYRAKSSVRSTADALVYSWTYTYTPTKGVASTWNAVGSVKCKTTGAAYFYTKASMTNGSASGTVSEYSALKLLTGCATV
jgi:hypothetical protein